MSTASFLAGAVASQYGACTWVKRKQNKHAHDEAVGETCIYAQQCDPRAKK